MLLGGRKKPISHLSSKYLLRAFMPCQAVGAGRSLCLWPSPGAPPSLVAAPLGKSGAEHCLASGRWAVLAGLDRAPAGLGPAWGHCSNVWNAVCCPKTPPQGSLCLACSFFVTTSCLRKPDISQNLI